MPLCVMYKGLLTSSDRLFLRLEYDSMIHLPVLYYLEVYSNICLQWAHYNDCASRPPSPRRAICLVPFVFSVDHPLCRQAQAQASRPSSPGERHRVGSWMGEGKENRGWYAFALSTWRPLDRWVQIVVDAPLVK